MVATGDTHAGQRAPICIPRSLPPIRISVRHVDPADLSDHRLDVVFLGLPHEASMALAPELVGKVGCVVDLSAAFRLKDAVRYPRWYGFEHDQPALLAEAVYGLPERHARRPAGGAPGRHAGVLRHRRDPRPRPAARRRSDPPRRA